VESEDGTVVDEKYALSLRGRLWRRATKYLILRDFWPPLTQANTAAIA